MYVAVSIHFSVDEEKFVESHVPDLNDVSSTCYCTLGSLQSSLFATAGSSHQESFENNSFLET